MPGQLHDWIAETPESIAAGLQGAQEAQRQTRFTLGLMTLISMMMLILSYNAYLSFDSRWITQLAEAHRIIESLETKIPLEDLLTHQALQDWANARNATIELLGIRVSVDDAPILGTTSLFVFALIRLCQGRGHWEPTPRSTSSRWSCSSRAGFRCSCPPLLPFGIREGPTPSCAITASGCSPISCGEVRGRLEWALDSEPF